MNILVTGATGFLGKRVCMDLIAQGNQIFALGRNKSVGVELEKMGCSFLAGDLRDEAFIKEICKDIDMVIHSGALSSPWGKKKNFVDINLHGTENIIAGCLEHKVKRLIYISSTSVYFDFKDRFNIKETDYVAHNPPSLYTSTKLMAEKAVIEVSKKSELETVIIRPRGIFGEGDTTLIPRLINAHDKGRLPIIGSPETLVDVTYVGNVSYSVLKAIKAPKEAMNEIYNITNGEPVKLWDMIEFILGKCDRKLKRKIISYKLVYMISALSEFFCKYLFTSKEPTLTRYTTGLLAKSQTLNIEKAQNMLGYTPQVNMDDALNRTINWYLGEVKNGA